MQENFHRLAEAEDVDLFDLLEQWEPTDGTNGQHSRTPFGSAPAQTSSMSALASSLPPSQAGALSTPVLEIPLPPAIALSSANFSPAFQQISDQAPGEAAYLMYAPGLCLKGRPVGRSAMPRAYSPAFTTWQRQPMDVPPQQSMSSALIAQGSLTSTSASLDAEDSTAAVSSPSQRRADGSRRHKTAAWRQKNRQAQKKFRQRKKDTERAREEELTRLTAEVDLLQRRKQELQEALAAAQQGVTGRAVTDTLTLRLQMAQVVLKQQDLVEMQVEGVAKLWKGMTQKMALYLPEAQRHPSGELARRVQALCGEAMHLLWALADYNPRALTDLEGKILELGHQACHEGSPWEIVLRQLQLAPQQEHAMCAVHDMLSSNLAQLLAKRRALVGRLQELPAEDAEDAEVQLYSGGQLVQQIRDNVHVAYVCKAYHVSHAWMKILSPAQRAQFMVLAFPYGPDMLSLMSVAARTASTTDSAERTSSDAASKTLMSPINGEGPALRSLGRTGLRGQTAEVGGSDLATNSFLLPDQADWRSALDQPLSFLRKES